MPLEPVGYHVGKAIVPKVSPVDDARFGLDVNLVVSRVIRAGLGRRFRVVTLDDGRFPALDMPPLERWLSRLAPPVGGMALIVWALILIPELQRSADLGGDLTIETGVMVEFWLTFACVVLALVLAHLWRVRRKASLSVTASHDIPKALCELASMRAFTRQLTMLAPQAVVIHVVDSLWRDVVATTATMTDMALIDVSIPSESLPWEIKELRGAAMPCLFIAEGSHYQKWGDATHGLSFSGHATKELIGHDPVLLYDAGDPLGGATFRRCLAEALSGGFKAASRPRRGQAVRRWRHFLREFGFYAAVAGGAVYFGFSVAQALAYVTITRWVALMDPDFLAIVVLVAALSIVNGILWLLRRFVRHRLCRPTKPGGEWSVWRRVISAVCLVILTISTIAYLRLIVSLVLRVPCLLIPVIPSALGIVAWWHTMRASPADEARRHTESTTA